MLNMQSENQATINLDNGLSLIGHQTITYIKSTLESGLPALCIGMSR